MLKYTVTNVKKYLKFYIFNREFKVKNKCMLKLSNAENKYALIYEAVCSRITRIVCQIMF